MDPVATVTNKDRLMVPVAHPDDLFRVGPVATQFATGLNLAITVATVVHPDADQVEALATLTEAAAQLTNSAGAPGGAEELQVDVHVEASSDVPSAVRELCTDQWTCMATHANPFGPDGYVGSFAAHILEHSTKPVILVGPRAEGGGHLGQVFAACEAGSDLREPFAAAESLAKAFGLPVAKLTIDPVGVVYESRYDDYHVDRPDEVHAGLRSRPLERADVISELCAHGERGLLVLATHARKGLAWICERSVSFDTVADCARPVVVVGPNGLSPAVPPRSV